MALVNNLMRSEMPRKFKFQYGYDPLGHMGREAIVDRISRLHVDYSDHVNIGDVVPPSKIHVWVVGISDDDMLCFASAKILGYADSIVEYNARRENGDKMTGIDAVNSLRMRGYIDCDPSDYPEVDNALQAWIMGVEARPRSSYRFLIHRIDLGRMSDHIVELCDIYDGYSAREKEIFLELVNNSETREVVERGFL